MTALFQVSKKAREDLRGIARFTRHQWGREHVRSDLAALDTAFHRLAEPPRLGHPCNEIPGYFRMEQGRHVVFFRPTEGHGLLEHRLPDRHLGDRNGS